MSEPFLGEIIMFGGTFAPRGWAFCNGQLLAISSNSALFAILGTTYGGDGRTTFGLPNLQGRVAMHPGTGPGLTTRRLGQTGGVENVTLTTQEIPSHTHTPTVNTTGAVTAKAVNAGGNQISPSGNTWADSGSNDRDYHTGTPDVDMNAAAINNTLNTTVTIGNTGGSQQHTNVQPFQCVNFIIALQGIFPSRN